MKIAVTEGVATLTMARPPVNALDLGLYEELAVAFAELARVPEVRAVVLASEARCFCAGADIKEPVAPPPGERARLARELFDAVRHHPTPVVAAVNGAALGAGAVLAACCDVRYGGESARIGLPEVNVGLLGGGRHLMRVMPQGSLREMYFTGGSVDARTALGLGLLQRVVPDGEELAAATGLAEEIATRSPQAIRLAKEALNAIEDLPVEEGYRLEQSFTRQLVEAGERS